MLTERASLGLDLWHPLDARIPSGDDPDQGPADFRPEHDLPTWNEGILHDNYKAFLEAWNERRNGHANPRPRTEQLGVAEVEDEGAWGE